MSNTTKKNGLARQLWLAYFNKTLRNKGFITEQEYRRLYTIIYSLPANPN